MERIEPGLAGRDDESARSRRAGPADRRRRPTRPWDILFTPGRRLYHRRAEDALRHPVLDRHGHRLRILCLAMLVLTLIDGALTLLLIESGAEEANPLMAHLLRHHGALGFLMGKYVLTAVCLPPLIVWKNHRMFRSCFRVKYLFPLFVGAYLVLTAFQLWALYWPGGPIQRSRQYQAAAAGTHP
jgi:hypothetical protein